MKRQPYGPPIIGLLTSARILFAFPLSFFAFAETDIHDDVIAALNWELPANTCSKPRLIAQSSNIVDGEGARAITDVDSYTIDRYERKERRWEKCIGNYKKRLMSDFEELKDSARHGLTRDQANQILSKMALIQQVYISPGGLLDAPGNVAND